MYLWTVRARMKPGQADEFARRWEELAAVNLKAMPGFRHAYLAGNHETDRMLAVTVWDTPPDPAQVNQSIQQMAERASDLIAEAPESEDHEVLVEV